MTATARGLRFRPYAGDGDITHIVRVVNAQSRADGIDEFWSEDRVRAWLSHPTEQFDARRDVVLAELDGVVVGAGGLEWVDTRDGQEREYRFWGAVDPEHRSRGIGTALLAHQEAHAGELAGSQDFDRRPVLGAWSAVGRPYDALLLAHGYRPARWFFDMVRPTLDDIELVELPAGLELRPVTAERHEAIWRANREAFRDHWGGSDESLDAMARLLDDPTTDTGLWLIAWEGDQVAGGVWNVIDRTENEELGVLRGWLASVFTRRPWRRRGLARALIGRSLALLRGRGMTSAGLGVDADNPSGALGLYEEAGFRVHERFTAMRKPMDGTNR